MYRFRTNNYKIYYTDHSPLEISGWQCFDAYDEEGDCFVVSESAVDYKTFEYSKDF